LRVPEDMPIENALITKSLESAQKKVEGNNFDIRKHLVEYDDILNKHRDTIYKKRRLILELANGSTDPEEKYDSIKDMVWEMIEQEVNALIDFHSNLQSTEDEKEIEESVNAFFPITEEQKEKIKKIERVEELKEYILSLAKEKFNEVEESLKKLPQDENAKVSQLDSLCKSLLLSTIDTLWVEHLSSIDYLRTGIGLVGYGQRDPLVEYKREAFRMFKTLLATIQSEVAATIFKLGQAAVIASSPMMSNNMQFSAPEKIAQTKGSAFDKMNNNERRQVESSITSSHPKDESGAKIGRNDPCYCGSGLKYKRCGLLNTIEHQQNMKKV